MTAAGLVLGALLLSSAAAACTGGGVAPAPASATAAATAGADAVDARLRAVDWRDRRYGIYTLRDGVAEEREYEEMGGRHDTTEWTLEHVAYVDLTGDGVAEALVRVGMRHWTTEGEPSRGTDLFIFAAPAGTATEPVPLGVIHSWAIPIIQVLTSGRELTLTLEASGGPCRERWVLGPGGPTRADDPPVCAPVPPMVPGPPASLWFRSTF